MDREIDAGVLRARRIRRGSVVAGCLVVIAALAFALPGLLRPSLSAATIRTAVVERGEVEALLQASGTVVPAFERVLASPVDARVLRLLHRPGDAVSAGESIVELDVTATRLDLDRASEQLSRKRSEMRQTELELDRELGDLAARREAKRLDVELYRYRLEQQRQLAVDGLTSDAALRQAEVELRKAEVELTQIDDTIDNTKRSVAERRRSLETEIVVLERERSATEDRLEQAEARTEADGVVTWVVSEVGSTVRAGDVLARVADLEAFRLEATVADAYASRVETGQAVRVGIDDARLTGHVTAVHPAVEAGAARFDVALDEPDHPALRPNRRVDVFVVTDRRAGALRVKKGPFARAGRRQPVFVVRGDRAWRVEAEFGVAGYDHLEIVEGLAEGDRVILSDTREFHHLESIGIR